MENDKPPKVPIVRDVSENELAEVQEYFKDTPFPPMPDKEYFREILEELGEL